MPGTITAIAYARAALVLVALSLLITREALAIWRPPALSPEMTAGNPTNIVLKPQALTSHDIHSAICTDIAANVTLEHDMTCYALKADEKQS
ncbi:uncharacterized protein F4807DRAFT_447298, partial [Annulohypoxylon truncatum]|uniref:uncharacterized protein n=1 Tax=Annulohypoxylon truncatum TaxID=327061 RepID=UPI0020080B3A